MKNSVIVFLFLIAFVLISCDKDEDSNDNPTGPPASNVKEYAGSGSNGDLVTFEIDKNALTWKIYNESTSQADSGSYSLMTGNLSGIFKIVVGTDTFYAVEMVDKFIVANFPTGNPLNNLSFGVTANSNHTNTNANIAGDYVFIEIDADGYYNDGRYKEWGVITVYPNNIFEGMSYATAGPYPLHDLIAPETWNDGFPLNQDSVDFDGTFSINGTYNERINVSINQDPSGNYNGYAYATQSTGVFIIDKGYGNGFILCVKVDQSSTIAAVSSDYKFVSVLDGLVPVGGNATISASGGTYYEEAGNIAESGTLQNIQQCPNIPNMYYADMYSTQLDGKIYFVVNEDIFFMIGFDTNGEFVIYGAGAKL
jgi:hypothetical protein